MVKKNLKMEAMRKKVKRMSEQEKMIEEKIATAVPLMTPFEKGYILGLLQGRVKEKEQEKKKEEYQPS